jgi:hypothetical protein
MGQSPVANTFMLAKIWTAQGKEAVALSTKCSPMSAPTSGKLSAPGERPAVLRVGVYGYDVVRNSPTADLLFSPLEYFCKDAAFEFFLFADGQVNVDHPPAADIGKLFEGRLTLFGTGMSATKKCVNFREAKLNLLVT